MILYRRYSGSYEESMKTVREVATHAELCDAVCEDEIGVPVYSDEVEVLPYPRPQPGSATMPGPMLDSRNGWTTYVVLWLGACVGFTNGCFEPQGPRQELINFGGEI